MLQSLKASALEAYTWGKLNGGFYLFSNIPKIVFNIPCYVTNAAECSITQDIASAVLSSVGVAAVSARSYLYRNVSRKIVRASMPAAINANAVTHHVATWALLGSLLTIESLALENLGLIDGPTSIKGKYFSAAFTLALLYGFEVFLRNAAAAPVGGPIPAAVPLAGAVPAPIPVYAAPTT